jgi:hypothetical protein
MLRLKAQAAFSLLLPQDTRGECDEKYEKNIPEPDPAVARHIFCQQRFSGN